MFRSVIILVGEPKLLGPEECPELELEMAPELELELELELDELELESDELELELELSSGLELGPGLLGFSPRSAGFFG
jgi:hypothetical protein